MDNYIIQEETLYALADAVREKAGITNDMVPDEIIREIYLLNTNTDTGAPAPGVIFYDYDGTVLYSYTVKEARALTTLPDGPVHDDLPFAGWTHSLEEVNATMKVLYVGAMYTPEITKLTVCPPNTWSSYGNVTLYFSQTVSNGVTVNWGDGVTNTVSGTGQVNISHSYPNPYSNNEYTIEITVTNGIFKLGVDNNYLFGLDSNNMTNNTILTKAIVGTNVTLGKRAFASCPNLKYIVIPVGVDTLWDYCFHSCESLTAIIVPNSVKYIYMQAFYRCESATVLVLPEGVNLKYAAYYSGLFYYMKKIENIILPSGVTDCNQFFYYNNLLKNIYIKALNPPSSNIGDIPTSCTVYVPVQSLEKYKTAKNWSNIADQIKGMPV